MMAFKPEKAKPTCLPKQTYQIYGMIIHRYNQRVFSFRSPPGHCQLFAMLDVFKVSNHLPVGRLSPGSDSGMGNQTKHASKNLQNYVRCTVAPFRAQAVLVWWRVHRKMTGCTSSRKKPAGRPKNTTTEVLDIAKIHQDWDGCVELRDRVMDGGHLLVEPHEDNIPSSVANFLALQPFITRMSLSSTRPLPAIETLREEVECFYLKCKRGGTSADFPDVVQIAWKVRKMLGFIKMKARRREVSSAPLFNFTFMPPHVRKE